MRIGVIYAGESGTTEKCAKIIDDRFEDVSLINLKEVEGDVNRYDLVILGASVRMGSVDKDMINFLYKNAEDISKKKCLVYLCCGLPENKEEYWKKAIPKELRNVNFYVETFGGEINMDKLSISDKMIIKMFSMKNPKILNIGLSNKNIENFIKRIKMIEEGII